MVSMFEFSNFTYSNISSLNVSSVDYMYNMFKKTKFTGNLIDWNFKKYSILAKMGLREKYKITSKISKERKMFKKLKQN